MAAESKRERIFRAGAAALRAISDLGDEELYACPLCRRFFDRDALEGPDTTLTLEHVPPRYLAGREILLTCKRCNSEGGHRLDAEALARREHIRAVRALVLGEGTYSGRATWYWGAERLAGDLVVRGTQVRLNVVGKAIDSEAGPRARGRIQDQQDRGEPVLLRIRPDVRFRFRESQIGDLRSGYLAAFAAFGYSYGFDPSLEPVRESKVALAWGPGVPCR